MVRMLLNLAWIVGVCAGVLVGTGAVGAGSCALGQTTVVIRANLDLSVTGESSAEWPLCVGDIAEVVGPDAETISRIVVAKELKELKPAGAGAGVVETSAVRAALEGARVNWGRVTLKSSAGGCTVRTVAAAPRRADGESGSKIAKKQFEVVETQGGAGTVRTAIAVRLASHFEVSPEALKLCFDAADSETLATGVMGRRCEVQPGGTGNSPRLPVRVEVYEGDRITLSKTVDVEVQVLRRVAVATAELRRGAALNEQTVRMEDRWVSPSIRVDVDLSGAGAVATQRIDANEVIVQERVERPLAAKRGDVVWVHCLSGSVTVKAKARAMGSARDGEEIVLQLDGRKESFRARMNGPGRAVMLVSDSGSGNGAGDGAGRIAQAGVEP